MGDGLQEAADEASLLLSLSARPVIWAGAGARGAGVAPLLGAVADLLAAPVVTSFSGKGALGEDHPFAVGSLTGAPEVARLLGSADAALALGTSFSPRSTRKGSLPLPMQLFHVDLDPSVPGTRYPVRMGIEADTVAALSALAPALRSRVGAGAGRDQAAQAARVAEVRTAAWDRIAAGGLRADLVLAALRRAIPPGIPTVWDVAPARWAVPLFRVPLAGTFSGPSATAAPGFSLGVARNLLGVGPRGHGGEYSPPEGENSPVSGGRLPAVVVASAEEVAMFDQPAGLPVVIVSFAGPEWAGVWDPAGAPARPADGASPQEAARRWGIPVEVAAGLADLPEALAEALARGGPSMVVLAGGTP